MIEQSVSYSEIVSNATSMNLTWTHRELDDRYLIWASGPNCSFETTIYKSNACVGGIDPAQEALNLSDFLEKYVALSNKKYEVRIVPDNVFQMQTDAVKWEFDKNTTSTKEFKIENHDGENYTYKYLSGADWNAYDAVEGDHVSFQIVDKDNVLGYGENVVLKTYVLKKYIWNNTPTECTAMAPGQIQVGLYLRCSYTSIGTVNNPRLYVNFHIEVKD